jgi:2,3-diketo-5-methylthio-1-phosphopentane phosphatase
VVVDFDGTITEQETLDALVDRFGDPEAHRVAQGKLGCSLTLHDVIARGYGSLRATRDEVVSWVLQNVRFRRGFRELVEFCRARGWKLVVVSSGLRELIEPVLRREGLELEVVANALEPGTDWEIAFRENRRCDACGELCKRLTVTEAAGSAFVVYVGDGYSDGCAAETAGLVFARRRLAEYMDERQLPYKRFEDFFDVLARLDSPA